MSENYDAAVLATLQPEPAQAARIGFAASVDTNPDDYAESRRVARRTGVPVDTVLSMPQEMKQQDRIGSIDFDALAKTSPATVGLLADMDRAKLAHDDVDGMTGFERVGRILKNSGRALLAVPHTTSAGLWGAAAAPFEMVGADSVGEWLRVQQKESKAIAKDVGPQGRPSGNIEAGWYSGLTSAGQNLLTLPLAFLPGGQNAALAAMVAPVFGESYGKGREAGLSPTRSALFGAQDAAAEWAGERLGLGNLVKNVKAGSGFGKTLIGFLAREVPGELATTVAQSFNEYANINPDKPVGEWLSQLPDELAQTVVATLVGGGAITTTVNAADKAISAILGKGQDAAHANQTGKLLTGLNKMAEAMKLRERDAETAQAFFQSVLEEGVDAVYITPDALAQSGLAARLSVAIPAVQEQLQTAAETGHDIRIPIADLMATMAGPELEQSLIPHLATEPGGFTPTTAQEYLQSDQAQALQAEVERVLDAKQGDESFKASADAVKANIRGQLDTAARFSPAVNEAYAAMVGNFYAVQAARTGRTPEEMLAKYPLRIVAQGIGGQQFDQDSIDIDGATRPTTDARGKPLHYTEQGIRNFWRWFDGVGRKRLDRQSETGQDGGRTDRSGDDNPERFALDHSGRPRDFYHGTADDFQTFDLSHPNRKDIGWLGNGVYLTSSADLAEAYSHLKAGSGNPVTMPMYAAVHNPLVVPLETKQKLSRLSKEGIDAWTAKVKDAGHDGVALTFGDGTIELVAFDPHQVKSAVGNRGTFDPNDANILHQSPDAIRGSFNPATLQLSLLKNANLSTFLHESGHFFLEVQTDLAAQLQQDAKIYGLDTLKPGERQILADTQALLDWFGIEDLDQWHNLDFEEKRSYHEQFARGFESYLFEGKAPSIELQGLFQRFRAWLLNVYRDLKALNVEITDEVRSVFDRMLATTEQITLAEQGRSMMPLFTSPEQAGMTVEEFAAYQASGVDSTTEAIDALQARGLRDMQWLHNARGRIVKQLQRESSSRRAEVQMEARREVMSQTIYQAWDFLTRKITEDDQITPPGKRTSSPDVVDETQDSLFAAIAKLGGLDRAQAQSEWGIDPKEVIPMPAFGKHVLRRKEGLSIDRMAESLSQYGYLTLDRDGKYDLREFEEKFFEELGGKEQYSIAYDYEANRETRAGDQVVNPGALLAGRLDRQTLASMDLPPETFDRLDKLRMVKRDALHPDIVAELFGFSSGDELVRELSDAEKPREAIDALTDQRMLEKYGDLSSPEAIARAADQAIHNDARARMVATEANALARAISATEQIGTSRTGRPIMRQILPRAAKEYASAMISRLKVRNVLPGQYASAGVRSGKAAEKASKAGDIATAAAEKRNQLINTYATRAAYDALEEVDRGLRYLKKFDSAGTRKRLDADYMDQIDALLERFDLRKQSLKAIDKRKGFAKWLAAQREAGLDPDVPPELENESNRKSYKDMAVEEFRGLLDTVKQIEHLGRLKRKLLTAKDRRDFAVIVAEVEDSIVEHGGDPRPVALETPLGIVPWLEGVAAGHRKFSSLLRQMDGGQDNGPMWRLLGRSMNEAASNEAAQLESATERLAAIYKPILALKGGTTGDKRYIREIGASMTRGGRLAVALNWGNETNRARVMDGDKWSHAQVNAILSTITRDEWAFVKNIWQFIDSYWPLIAEKERRVTGRAPEKVAADPFTVTLADGSTMALSGGYYPIKYDSSRDDRAEKHDAAAVADDMKRGAFTRATTRRGHTKERVESVKRPVRKTLDVITQHVSEVTHDLAWHEWLIDANRLIDAKPINSAIREYYGPEVIKTMKDHLSAIATADIVPQTKIDQALLYLRANVSRSTMGLSLTTAFLQPFGLTQSMVRIGPRHVLRGMARWGGDIARFENSISWIAEKSEFMRLRSKTFNRELHEINGRVSQGRSSARQIYDASLFMLMRKMQMVADVPTWIGAYEKATAEERDEATAVAMADQAVLDSQGGGQTKDMAEFQRKHPMLAMFYSYFNVTLNLAAESTARTDFKSPLAVAGWFSDMALLMVIPALGPAILLELLRGGGDDDGEEWAKKLAKWQASYLLGTVIGVREASGLVSGYDYAGPPVGRVIADLGSLGKQVAQGEMDENLALSSLRFFGSATGIPTVQLIRSWRGWKAWSEGEASPASVLLGPPTTQ